MQDQDTGICSFDADSVVLVTGASSGIGAAIALKLNALGAAVIANGTNVPRLEAVRERARHPDRFHLAPRDLLADIDQLASWVKELCARHGKLSGLAIAAGKTETIPFAAYERARALALFDLLFHVPLEIAKAAVDRRNCLPGRMKIVFIAAAASIAPNKGQIVYGAAKAALACAARCMSKELAPRGICVNCISPGLVRTAMFDETVALLGEDFLNQEAARYPLGIGDPEDIAGLAAFLLSPAARWMTGQNLLVDGGRIG